MKSSVQAAITLLTKELTGRIPSQSAVKNSLIKTASMLVKASSEITRSEIAFDGKGIESIDAEFNNLAVELSTRTAGVDSAGNVVLSAEATEACKSIGAALAYFEAKAPAVVSAVKTGQGNKDAVASAREILAVLHTAMKDATEESLTKATEGKDWDKVISDLIKSRVTPTADVTWPIDIAKSL